MNFRDAEFTLSGGFTGNYLEDDPTGYVALGIYRSFRACETSLCQIALPAPLRQCLASTSACVTQTGPARHCKHRPLWSCILCRGMSTGLPEGLPPEMTMTRRRQTKQTGVLAYPHFLFAVVTQAIDARGLRHARDDHAVATARRDDRPHAEVTRAQFYRQSDTTRRPRAG